MPTVNNVGAMACILRVFSKYSVARVAIPSNKLHVGNHTSTLDHELHSNHGTAGPIRFYRVLVNL